MDDPNDNPNVNQPASRIFVEQTLALIKPDAVKNADEIEEIILQAGFTVLQKRHLQLSTEQCCDFYAEHYGKPCFHHLTEFMSSGPVVALLLARQKAIAAWKAIMGPMNSVKARETHPDCLRAQYGTNDLQNAVHGSDSYITAEKEIRFIFPDSVIQPPLTGEDATDFLSRYVSPTLLKGLTELCKTKPEVPLSWLADWLKNNNPNKPKIEEAM